MKNLNLILVCVLLITACRLKGQQASYVRIKALVTKEQMRQWQHEGLLPSHFHYKNGIVEMELDPAEMSLFRKKGIRYTDITTGKKYPAKEGQVPGQKIISTVSNFTYGSMGGYYTYQEAMDILDSMRARFPALVSRKDTLGFTYEGRPIVAVRISDNPDSTEISEDEWLMTALHHSNEVMGVHIVTYFAWYVLENYQSDKEIRNLLNNSALYLVPVVNPDGLVYNETSNPSGGGTWRKNRKPRVISSTTYYGVDLNRNYGYNWGYTHSGQLGQAGSNFAGNNYYRGTTAWSESETQALRNLCNAHRFVSAFNYHAWDDSFNYPWNFDEDSLTVDSIKFNAIASYCTQENNFEKGTFDNTLGYTANGTSDDWLYGEQTTKPKIFPFTIEVGKSFWPAQSLIIPYCDSLLQANIKMLRMAAKYAAIEEISMDTLTGSSCAAVYNLKRYSIKDTGFTISVIPLDGNIISTGPAKSYTGISFLETVTDSILFSLDTAIPNGSIVRFLLKVDNGAWFTVDTISKLFLRQTVLAMDCRSRKDSNHSMSSAVQVHPGISTAGVIEKRAEENWYYVQNSDDRKNIRIILSELPADYDMELLDEYGQKIAYSNQPGRINDTIVYNVSRKGSFRIRVYGYKNSYQPFECYSIVAALSDKPFDKVYGYFPNEKSGTATEFSIFPQPVGSSINITVRSTRSQSVSWVLYDNAGRQLNTGSRIISKGNSAFAIDARYLDPGLYFVSFFIKAGGEVTSFKIIKQ